jgi:hypothetical protein
LTDIPNYIGIPLSALLSIIIVVYQNEILEFFNRRKQISVMKNKNKAIEKYMFFRKMHNDALFFQTTIKLEEHRLLADGFMALLSMMLCVGFLQNSTHEIVKIIASAFDLKITDEGNLAIAKEIQRQDFQLTDTGYVFTLTFAFVISVNVLARLAALRDMVQTTRNFEKFEAEIKQKWPDALKEKVEALK